MNETTKMVVQFWYEHERGWGVRPDGYSLHLSLADRENYIKAYWDRMPAAVPDEYSSPDGLTKSVNVPIEIANDILFSKRFYDKPKWLYEQLT